MLRLELVEGERKKGKMNKRDNRRKFHCTLIGLCFSIFSLIRTRGRENF